MLEGDPYDGFVVPNCQKCLAEDRINSVVRSLAHRDLHRPQPRVVKAGRYILWGIDTQLDKEQIICVTPIPLNAYAYLSPSSVQV